jgi:hypothetical protein
VAERTTHQWCYNAKYNISQLKENSPNDQEVEAGILAGPTAAPVIGSEA